MKIMVVGSSGYIGRHVVKNLASQGADVIAFDLVPAAARDSVAGVPFIQGNMTNLEEVLSAILENGIQRIVARC
jgi:nucleoside-diphosphate-sugar epimerase